MQLVDLFSGIGGFPLAASWLGWETKVMCENDQFCQKVLNYHFPNATLYEDIKQTDFSIWRGSIDILTGGFPCQPYSQAGERKGTEDERHLWPEMLRAIREIQPKWVVGENVHGLVNWNGGLVFEQVQADMEAEGYEVQPLILPAAGVDAPHKRDRVFFVAYTKNNGRGSSQNQQRQRVEAQKWEMGKCETKGWDEFRGKFERYSKEQFATNTQITGIEGECEYRQTEVQSDRQSCGDISTWWQDFPTQPPVCRRNDGFPGMLDSDAIFERLGIKHPREPAIGFAKWRNESIKGLGNAVVPQVVYEIFKVIDKMEKECQE